MQVFSEKMVFFGPRHLGERSGSGPQKSKSSRENENTHQSKGSKGSPGVSRVS